MAKEILEEGKETDREERKEKVLRDPASKKETKPAAEAVYPASELAGNARNLFRTRPECVSAALKAAGRSDCTISEAKGIVEKFLKREVR